MKRRAFLVGLGAMAIFPRGAHAQALRPRDGRERFRVGVLVSSADGSPGGHLFESLRKSLEGLGYREGLNLEFVVRPHERENWRPLAELAREVIDSAPDVIIAVTTPQTDALKALTRAIPIVMVAPSDPVGSGLIESLARPGGNVTGFANNTIEVLGKQAALLKEIAPGFRKLGFLINTANPLYPRGTARWAEIARSISGRLEVEVVLLPYTGPEDFDTVFDRPVNEKSIDAVVVVADGVAFAQRDRVTKAAIRNRLPAIYAFKEEAAYGGLLAYGTDLADLYARAGGYADQLLRARDPATMPVQFPVRYNFVVNLKTARTLGIDIPTAILAQADEVIE